MMRLIIVTVLALLASLVLTGCKDAPGADGRYAHRDHGNYRPP